MKVSQLELINIKSYESANINLCPKINLLVGNNNSGKSVILTVLLALQHGFSENLIRKTATQGVVRIHFVANTSFEVEINKHFDLLSSEFLSLTLREQYITLTINDRSLITTFNNKHLVHDGANTQLRQESEKIQKGCIYSEEPKNFIYQFLSKRKTQIFEEGITSKISNKITGNFSNLFAKVDRIMTDGLPAKEEFIRVCKDILGFTISSYPSDNGKKAVYIIDNFNNIALEDMGEGVANILGLILDLCVAKDQLFLIEELENDIHPKALKKLLSFILEKSENNQFLITTHSNIVLKYLASDELTKVFKVDMDFNDMKIPTSSINEVANSFEARREILEDLGYELTDFDISVAWLVLEESSAETIIKDFLIPHFASSLKGKLRTCSANGISKISARFEAIHSLCLFLHLEKVFNDKILVLIDKGENEAKIIQDLKNSYKSWNQDRFYQLSKHDFEEYYPPKYKQKVSDILQISNSQEKRTKKKELLQEVEKWYRDEPETAKADFMTSASEVINLLKTIEASVT